MRYPENYTAFFNKFEDEMKDDIVSCGIDSLHLFARVLQTPSMWNVTCNPPRCGTGVYAFVLKRDPTHNVNLCSEFWAAKPVGYPSSQVGTLYHEFSHFQDVADTWDIAYGPDMCMGLAVGCPVAAAENADSYEYYAELVTSTS